MDVKFTDEQMSVIDARKSNILVSAAAGSGKTAVLVERIIRLIEEGTDVDHLLVVTFTKAAAAQMKEKITAAVQKRLMTDPDNAHMQRQETLIHNAQITTIDSFCQYIIRNNFNAIGLDPSFRVGDEGELKLIKEDVMRDMLEEEYALAKSADDSDFLFCMDYFSSGSRDDKAEEYINQLFNFSMSMPWPEDWINERASDYDIEGRIFDELFWVKECVSYSRRIIDECALKMEECVRISSEPDGPYMYLDMVEAEKSSVLAALQHNTYDSLYMGVREISFGRASSKKDDSVNADKRDYVKQLRSEVKDDINTLVEKYFALRSETITEQMKLCDRAVKELCRLTIRFKRLFDEKKREKGLIDFSDMEHFALQILADHPGPDECTGLSSQEIIDRCTPSSVALEYRDYYKEVLIDEYQDSNNVQELILKSIAGERCESSERFMVGDVKQSIYKFRLARPEIFMEKLCTYDKSEKAQNRRIDLHKNFRSRKEVLEITNFIFAKIMGADLGGVEYDKDAYLVTGAEYEAPSFDMTPEFMILDGSDVLTDYTDAEYLKDLSEREKEALLVSERILELKSQDKDLKYKDIVILLRSLSGWDDVFKKVLESQGIPVYTESKSGYFDAPEVAVLLNMLSVIDNPRQDIPLISVMHSCIADFSDEELARIKIAINKSESLSVEDSFYDCLIKGGSLFEELEGKINAFVGLIERFRKISVFTPVHELLGQIIDETGYEYKVTAMPSGGQRKANIDLLLSKAVNFERTSFKGLFHFVRYIEHIKFVQADYGEAGVIDENADVVRIMSIHKSKGLEFPVVFVSGLSKEFNQMDTRGDLITDMDLGIGVRSVNTNLRVKYDTLKRRIIADKMTMDSLGEEIRVLYVALTRAKEKLIMTAFSKDLSKELSAYLKKIPAVSKNALLPYSMRSGSSNYFSLIMPCLIAHPGVKALLQKYEISTAEVESFFYGSDVPKIEFKSVGESDLKASYLSGSVKGYLRKEELKSALKSAVLEDEEGLDNSSIDADMYKRLKEKFSSEYGHKDLKGLFTKTTVSELKKARIEELMEISSHSPSYAKEKGTSYEGAPESKLTGAERGTAYHRIMELLDEEIYGDEDLMIRALSDKEKEGVSKRIYAWGVKKAEEGLISSDEQKAVWSPDIVTFLATDLGQRMGKAFRRGELMREKPFMMGVSAKELNTDFPSDEMVLVQGIIDAWFIEDGQTVLLDYKTDKVDNEKELADRYRVQLELYKRAMEASTNMKVKEVYIYSFTLGKVIRLDL